MTFHVIISNHNYVLSGGIFQPDKTTVTLLGIKRDVVAPDVVHQWGMGCEWPKNFKLPFLGMTPSCYISNNA